jgi:hypothetical protein
MPLVKQGVVIVTRTAVQDLPAADGDLTFVKVDAPIVGNQTVPITLTSSDAGIRDAWFTPIDNLVNIAKFDQIFVQSVRNGKANLVVKAHEEPARIIGIVYGLI